MSVVTGLAPLVGRTFDVCVIGAGPVGLAAADRMARKGLSVLVLESGSHGPAQGDRLFARSQIVDPTRHEVMSLVVTQALGGASWLWGGRCMPLDPVDFSPRGWLPQSGWPVSYADVNSYVADAAAFIGCGSGDFERPLANSLTYARAEISLDHLERWCDEPRLAVALASRPLHEGVTVALDATAVDLHLDDWGESISAISVFSACATEKFDRAKTFVVAGGGIGSARLLLQLQAREPQLFGGPDGPLGRYYMGHLSGKIASIRFSDPRTAKLFGYETEGSGVYRRRFTLSPGVMASDALPNVIFYPDNPRLSDPSHCRGLLSALFLALSMPVLGRRFMSEAIRRMQMTQNPRYLQHVRNLLLDGPRAAAQVAGVLWQKFGMKRQKPFVFLHSKSGDYPLHYHGEHAPSAQSRVTLNNDTDACGMRGLSIDLRFGAEDGEAIARAHAALDRVLRASGLGVLNFDAPREEQAAAVLAQARDGFHQMGLTRMGVSASDGVVDSDCKVFGLGNLYVASSGIFRTGGQANPTLPAMAFGLRLADHLVTRLQREAFSARSAV